MPISDAAFERAMQRKNAQVAALMGRDAPPPPASPDKTREALEAHASAVERASVKAELNVGRVPIEREPVRSWVHDYQVRVGDFSLPASLLLVGLLQNERGPALVAEIANASPELAAALLSHLRHS